MKTTQEYLDILNVDLSDRLRRADLDLWMQFDNESFVDNLTQEESSKSLAQGSIIAILVIIFAAAKSLPLNGEMSFPLFCSLAMVAIKNSRSALGLGDKKYSQDVYKICKLSQDVIWNSSIFKKPIILSQDGQLFIFQRIKNYFRIDLVG